MASYEHAISLLQGSPSRPTLYSVQIFKGPFAEDNYKRDYLKLFCNRIVLPGLEYERVAVIGQEDHGLYRDQPTALRFSGGNLLSMDIIDNKTFTMYESFRALFNTVALGSNPSGPDKTRGQRMNYYKDYVFNMQVDKLENTGASKQYVLPGSELDKGYLRVARYTFENCYVRDIGPMSFDASAFDQITTFNTNVSYETYHYDNTREMQDDRQQVADMSQAEQDRVARETAMTSSEIVAAKRREAMGSGSGY